MRRHGPDLLADLGDDTRRSRIRRAQYADCVHQLLDRDGRMVDLSLRDQVVQHLRRTILHLINVDAGVDQETLSANPVCLADRTLSALPPSPRLFPILPRPT